MEAALASGLRHRKIYRLFGNVFAISSMMRLFLGVFSRKYEQSSSVQEALNRLSANGLIASK